jgi:hypothetical protein
LPVTEKASRSRGKICGKAEFAAVVGGEIWVMASIRAAKLISPIPRNRSRRIISSSFSCDWMVRMDAFTPKHCAIFSPVYFFNELTDWLSITYDDSLLTVA